MSATSALAHSPGVSRPGPGALIAWHPKHELDLREWAAAGRRIGSVSRSIQWLLGDWIAYGNLKFGERYTRAAQITGYDTQTLMNMVYVAARFPASRRREKLSWSHHEAVAALGDADQVRWLDQAAVNRWSVADLRTMLRAARRESDDGHREGDWSADGAAQEALAQTAKCPRCGETVQLSS
jgi:hypothetical protein